MSALMEVISDLVQFAVVDAFRSRSHQTVVVANNPHVLALPTVPVLSQKSSSKSSKAPAVPVSGEAVYVGELSVPLLLFPTTMVDGVLAEPEYGSELTVNQVQGQWLQVAYRDQVGWCRHRDTVLNRQQLLPTFWEDEFYHSTHPETVRLRRFIKDEFAAGHTESSLQAIEYIAYRLTEAGRLITWPPERPRIAGAWQRILKGQSGIHIGIHPKTGSVLERQLDDGSGEIFYVEAVFPDQSVRISSIGAKRDGYYEIQTISSVQWREWRPVFISVT